MQMCILMKYMVLIVLYIWICGSTRSCETFTALLAFLRGTISHRRIPLRKASFLWSAPEYRVKQIIDTHVIWEAIAPIMTSL